MSEADGVSCAPAADGELVPSIKTIEDRRSSFRMNSDHNAVLRFRGREILVEMGDQSRGGFLVWMEKAPPFKVNMLTLLRTVRGWSTVRVAYVEKIEGRFRVGLEFLSDMEDPRDRRFKIRGGMRWGQPHSGGDWVFFFGIVAAASLVGFAVIAYQLFPELEIWRHFGRMSGTVRQAWQAVWPF